MTTKQLIAKLELLPEEAEVIIGVPQYGMLFEIENKIEHLPKYFNEVSNHVVITTREKIFFQRTKLAETN